MTTSILTTKDRIAFDATNQQHRVLYYNFKRTGRWGNTGCPFIVKWPYLSVPAMCDAQVYEFFSELDLKSMVGVEA